MVIKLQGFRFFSQLQTASRPCPRHTDRQVIYCWVSAILFQVPILCIVIKDCTALTHRYDSDHCFDYDYMGTQPVTLKE